MTPFELTSAWGHTHQHIHLGVPLTIDEKTAIKEFGSDIGDPQKLALLQVKSGKSAVCFRRPLPGSRSELVKAHQLKYTTTYLFEDDGSLAP
jgi:hypothetical protein